MINGRDNRGMPAEHERKKVALEYCRRVTAGDTGDIVDLFHPDATIEDPVGSGPVTGHEALREYYRNITENYQAQVEPDEPRGSHDAAFVAVPMTVTARLDGASRQVRSVDVFEIDDDHKITRMWAYWGPSDVS